MIEKLINNILDLKVFRTFKVKTTPRWIVLLLDMLIVICSFAATVVAGMYSTGALVGRNDIIINGVLVLVIYFLVSYISKSYTCVIRLSVIEDLYRIFMVVAVSISLLVGINLLRLALWNTSSLHFWDILVIGAFSFSLMMVERLCIKYLYMRMNSATKGRKRVLVLGTSFSSVFLANARLAVNTCPWDCSASRPDKTTTRSTASRSIALTRRTWPKCLPRTISMPSSLTPRATT